MLRFSLLFERFFAVATFHFFPSCLRPAAYNTYCSLFWRPRTEAGVFEAGPPFGRATTDHVTTAHRRLDAAMDSGEIFTTTCTATASGWLKNRTGAVAPEKNPPGDSGFFPAKAYWLIFRKMLFQSDEKKPRDLVIFFWQQGVLAHF